ncbi:MAG: 3-dehydroquinate synthase [Roseofilum sp. Belize BBD 4]|uniref:3-dehydroquinate synthase n=1 Tax=Roseofilum sp. Belize BBD 4 TaxID=2821500 RepID=UPI000E9BC332|nr:3-dehydroquinate synthase [Roseofilum sp. Belize BBD 4]MBP0035158.1 3-dehydroquinate synthase [Roseofilum sp. Belize BBD 4]HBQ99382.1 3-dehydroquinate synthase [Cyanobacteria bacterium UBA11691]
MIDGLVSGSTVRVELGVLSYEIAIAPASLDELGPRMAQFPSDMKSLGKKVLVVSNPTISDYYAEQAIASLTHAGFTVYSHLIPAGEQYKTLDSIQTIYDCALENRLERSSTLVALGGGVIGDMTGFAAATWLRGVNFVQVPTSLLAMVDASIGGKTGVNHPLGKNLIGAFYQPRLVWIDPQVLKTLPEREFRAGMAEVIKYGVIWDLELFERLERSKRLDRFEEIEPELLNLILTRSCEAKAQVVSEDEKEVGLRAILNYGHTIGHAIESLTGYEQVIHGEAVAIGMVAVSKIALKMGFWGQDWDQRQLALIEKTGLPTRIPSQVSIESILDSLQTDKKVKSGRVRFILPTEHTEAKITDQVPPDILREVLASLGASGG